MNYYNFSKSGVNFFSTGVSFVSGENIYNEVTGYYSKYNTIDNSYVCLILQMGLVATLTYIIGHITVCKKALEENNISVLTSIILITILGMFESSILEIYINIPFLYMLTNNGTKDITKTNSTLRC